MRLPNIRRKIKEYKRVISIARKPSKEEFINILKISLTGILIMGFIGFLVQLFYHYVLGVFI